MHVGRDVAIPISLQKQDKDIIVSPAYLVFSIKDESVIPEYALIWMSRCETERYAWFISDTSIRGGIEKGRFYEIDIPVPTVDEQKSLVEIYNALSLRKNINERLKAQIKEICPILIKGSMEEGQ
jgi:type I restriction enzyme S subunit